MLPSDDLVAIIMKGNIVGEPELKLLTDAAAKEHIPLEEYLLRKNIVSESLLYQTAATVFEIPYVDLKEKTIRREVLELIPEQFAHAHQLVAWDDNGTALSIALADPHNMQAIEFVEKKTGRALAVSMTSPANIREVLKLYHKSFEAEVQALQGDNGEVADTALAERAQELPVVRVVETMLNSGVAEGASDIHIEPTDHGTTIRFRVDGILKKEMELPKVMHDALVARIKVLSNLKIDEHRLPQDGRFKLVQGDQKISSRVSIIPIADGEKVVIRLLHESARPLTLEQIGLQKDSLKIVERNITKPHGMLLVTGPTGSGKTTTLYTVLNMLNRPEVNILTVEDPIEYRMPGVNQSQVNPRIGFTFANALRSFLRQDPNVIMVGEIRDLETAEIAVHAALTGHLVLSTLHTNDAVTTLPRLLDMGIAPFLIASTANLIMAQRLVRKICPHCVESVALTATDIEELKSLIPLDRMEETFRREGALAKNQRLDTTTFYRGKGCKKCGDSGYKGRIGIYEVLEVTPDIQEKILSRASREDLIAAARAQHMQTLLEDGLLKAKNGITTIAEVLRVTKE